MTVYIAPSIYRALSVRTASCLWAAMSGLGEPVDWQPLWGDAAIARSRSVLMTWFLQRKDIDVMVTIDDDIIFAPEELRKIIAIAREKRSIACGAYMTHSAKPHLTSTAFEDFDFEFGPESKPLEIRYGATGFMAIHRDVVEAMVKGTFEDSDGTHTLPYCTQGSGGDNPFYPFFNTFAIKEGDGYLWLSEDFAFCERARQLGFKVWMDRSINLGHMTEHAITTGGQFGPTHGSDNLLMQFGMQEYEPLPITNLPFVDTLTRDIAEFSGQAATDIAGILASEQSTGVLARMWTQYSGEEDELAWYKRSDVGRAHILALAEWQTKHPRGRAQVELVTKYVQRGMHVLDVGAGIGTAALTAASQGAHVVVVEPNPIMREFIEFRANKANLKIDICDETEGFDEGRFDVALCWHVLEHLEDPERMVRDIKEALKPDVGALFSDSDFEDGGEVHPMHHDFTGDWDLTLARHGFIQGDEPYFYRLGPVYRHRGLEVRLHPMDRIIASHLGVDGEWEKGVADAIDDLVRPGDRFLDLGSHVGIFAMQAARKAAHVVAFEANPFMTAIAAENYHRNGLEVWQHEGAVVPEENKRAAYLSLDVVNEDNYGAAYVGDDGMQVHAIPIDTVNVLYGPFDVIKADVEGLEPALFKACPELLKAARVVIVEVSPRQLARYGMTVADLFDSLKGFDVRRTDGSPATVEQMAALEGFEYENLVCVKVAVPA